MTFNPQTFGRLEASTAERVCNPRYIHVPLQFQIAAAAAGELVYSDLLDLTTFLMGNPSPFVDNLQTLIGYQNSKDSSGNLVDQPLLSEFIFSNGFRCALPGRSYTAISIISDNAPKAELNIYAVEAIAAPFTARLDFYFGNANIDQTQFRLV